ncbi:MAG: transporter ATP-binding protein [Fibrobacteria bacterium]|nr:transporter ATP-binding protein [Fibrobacteria bacterium]
MPMTTDRNTRTQEQAEDVPLRVRGLVAGYGTRKILDGVDVEVPREEIRVILGGSGSGKSTFLRNVMGLEQPWAGSVELFGKPVDWSQGRPPDDSYKRIGVLFQAGALISSLTVEQNVALPLRIHNPGLSDALLRELAWIKLKQVRMEEAGDKMPGELSGGMRKRAGLARALATDPELLFCDEPSAGLDPVTSRSLDDLLLELRETLGITMVVITHELDSIKALADKVTYLSQGKIIFEGTLDEAAHGPQEVQDFLDRTPPDGDGKDEGVMAFNLED